MMTRTLHRLFAALIVLLPLAYAGLTAAPASAAVDAGAVLALVNDARAQESSPVPPLSMDSRLTAAAQRHSNDMATNDFLDHVGSDGSTVGGRVNDAGYSWTTVGENVLQRYDEDPGGIFSQWRSSPGHNANMMSAIFSHMGLACATHSSGRVYCTMVLASGDNAEGAPSALPPAGASGGSSGGTTGGTTNGSTSGSSGSQTASPLANWEGNPNSPNYDGRLNPHPAEYYTIGCANDTISVYVAVGGLVNSVPIATVLGMNVGGATLNIGAGMTVARNGDSVTIGGSNGNTAPQFGTKEFRLSECLARNGRTPTPVVPANQNTLPPTASGQTTPANTAPANTTPLNTTPANTGANQGLTSIPPGARTHTMRAGENLFRIALRYGVRLDTLIAVNNITDVRRVPVGLVLVIP